MTIITPSRFKHRVFLVFAAVAVIEIAGWLTRNWSHWVWAPVVAVLGSVVVATVTENW